MDKDKNGAPQVCSICSTRKNAKKTLQNSSQQATVELNCPDKHKVCQNCILIYSRIKSDCPLCGQEYTQIGNGSLDKPVPIPEDNLSDDHLDEGLTSRYLEYLETVTAISSDEEEEEEEGDDDDDHDKDDNEEGNKEDEEKKKKGKQEVDRSTLAERLIRRRIKSVKNLLSCNGVGCESSGCSLRLHSKASLTEDPIEMFEVDNFDWKEPSIDEEDIQRKPFKPLKREKTVEELLDECEQFVKEAIIEEELNPSQ